MTKEMLDNLDRQMEAERNRKPLGDRRQQVVPVAEDRRKGPDRRGAPRRADYKDSASFNKAYDRWSENQR